MHPGVTCRSSRSRLTAIVVNLDQTRPKREETPPDGNGIPSRQANTFGTSNPKDGQTGGREINNVTQITVLRRGCPVCGSNQLRSWVKPKDQDLLFSCDNWNHPHKVVLDGGIVSLRDQARAGGYGAMFYFALSGHFEIPGYPRVLDGTPAVVPAAMARTYDLDQVHAAAKAVLLSRAPARASLDDVADVVVRMMRALRPAATDQNECARVILAICREVGIGARLRVLAASESPGRRTSSERETIAT
jgi:hypothetical protein